MAALVVETLSSRGGREKGIGQASNCSSERRQTDGDAKPLFAAEPALRPKFDGGRGTPNCQNDDVQRDLAIARIGSAPTRRALPQDVRVNLQNEVGPKNPGGSCRCAESIAPEGRQGGGRLGSLVGKGAARKVRTAWLPYRTSATLPRVNTARAPRGRGVLRSAVLR